MLDKFFLKYEGGGWVKLTLPRRNYPQKPSVIKVNKSLQNETSIEAEDYSQMTCIK